MLQLQGLKITLIMNHKLNKLECL